MNLNAGDRQAAFQSKIWCGYEGRTGHKRTKYEPQISTVTSKSSLGRFRKDIISVRNVLEVINMISRWACLPAKVCVCVCVCVCVWFIVDISQDVDFGYAYLPLKTCCWRLTEV